jgi:hypothetical protein
MTVKELKMALAALGTGADHMEFRIWLPGSEIYLAAPHGMYPPPAPFFANGDKVYIEGNLTKDSLLAKG